MTEVRDEVVSARSSNTFGSENTMSTRLAKGDGREDSIYRTVNRSKSFGMSVYGMSMTDSLKPPSCRSRGCGALALCTERDGGSVDGG